MSYLPKDHFFEMQIDALTLNDNPHQDYTLERLSSKAMLLEEQIGRISIQYVDTIVFEWQEDSHIFLNTGGWRTQTTKRWIQYGLNKVEPGRFHLYQKDFAWYIEDRQGETIEFSKNTLTINL